MEGKVNESARARCECELRVRVRIAKCECEMRMRNVTVTVTVSGKCKRMDNGQAVRQAGSQCLPAPLAGQATGQARADGRIPPSHQRHQHLLVATAALPHFVSLQLLL